MPRYKEPERNPLGRPKPVPKTSDATTTRKGDPRRSPNPRGQRGQYLPPTGGGRGTQSAPTKTQSLPITHEPSPDPQLGFEPDFGQKHQEVSTPQETIQKKERQAEIGVTRFSKGLVKTFVSGIIGAALFPFVGPVVAAAATITALVVTSIQDELQPLGLHLQEDTINKLIEPLHGKQFDESDLRKVIEEVLSTDRRANEDLTKAFIGLIPTIKKAASTNIEISGPVQGLITGGPHVITQTFNGFLPKDTL